MSDVAVAWAAFEEINQVRVTVDVQMAERGAVREPRLFGQALLNLDESTDPKPSDYVSASSWVFNHKSLDNAVFHLLYTLDGLIAERELAIAGKKEA
jgi:hypothetical protein